MNQQQGLRETTRGYARRAERSGEPFTRAGDRVRGATSGWRGGEYWEDAGSWEGENGHDFERSGRSAHVWDFVTDEQRLAKALGWFSIGLGLTELLAPRALARAIGIRNDSPALVRACGMREIAAGVGILSDDRPVGWLWSRVAGDAMDLALLGGAAADPCGEADRGKLAAATAAVVGVTALDFLASTKMAAECAAETDSEGRMLRQDRGSMALLDRGEDWRNESERSSRGLFGRARRERPTPRKTGEGVHVRRRMFVNRAPEELFAFWLNLANLPSFMRHLECVEVLDKKRSRWAARGPAGAQVDWHAEIIELVPSELIAWASLEGADVENSGFVRFERAPGDRGSIVTVEMWYRPPAGRLGMIVAKLFGEDPEWQIEEDLRRFKALMETGEVPVSDGVLWGRAQPPPREQVEKIRQRGDRGTVFGSESAIARERAEQHIGTEQGGQPLGREAMP